MALGFRIMNYPYHLYETVRNYFAVNAAGNLSILFKYMACFVQPLIAPFDAYDTFRQLAWLIAQCTWEVGQLTNVLNIIYDPSLKRIYIGQSVITAPADPGFAWTPTEFDTGFAWPATVYERGFYNAPATSILTFFIPTALAGEETTIFSTISQMAPAGIPWIIQLY